MFQSEGDEAGQGQREFRMAELERDIAADRALLCGLEHWDALSEIARGSKDRAKAVSRVMEVFEVDGLSAHIMLDLQVGMFVQDRLYEIAAGLKEMELELATLREAE
jgi:hypothetical protein